MTELDGKHELDAFDVLWWPNPDPTGWNSTGPCWSAGWSETGAATTVRLLPLVSVHAIHSMAVLHYHSQTGSPVQAQVVVPGSQALIAIPALIAIHVRFPALHCGCWPVTAPITLQLLVFSDSTTALQLDPDRLCRLFFHGFARPDATHKCVAETLLHLVDPVDHFLSAVCPCPH